MITDAQIALFVAGLLDPDDALDLAERARADDRLATRIRRARQTLAAVAPAADPWRLPPTGACLRALAVRPATFGRELLRVGQRFQILIDPIDDAAGREVLVLQRIDGRWVVRAPMSAGERVGLLDLQRTDQGAHRVDLRVAGPPGPQRWAVVLPPESMVDWASEPPERFDRLRAALVTGEVPAATVAIEVEEF